MHRHEAIISAQVAVVRAQEVKAQLVVGRPHRGIRDLQQIKAALNSSNSSRGNSSNPKVGLRALVLSNNVTDFKTISYLLTVVYSY